MVRTFCLSVLVLAGCANPPEGRFRCDTAADCPDGWYCHTSAESPTQALCYSTSGTEMDAGAPTDAGPGLDASGTDAAIGDAGPDAGPPVDAGGPTDAGADAGPPGDGGSPVRYALAFDGDGDEVQLPTDLGDPGTRFTIEMWVRPTSGSAGGPEGEGGLLFVNAADCTDINLEWSGTGDSRQPDRFRMRVYPLAGCSWAAAEATSTSSIGDWHHVAEIFDDGAMRLYVDGSLAGSATLTGGASWTSGTIGNYVGRDGRDPRPNRGAFIGEIDEMRISRVVRYTGSSISPPAHFASDADTVGVWLFDEGTGTTVADGSPNGLDGTVVNATWVASSR